MKSAFSSTHKNVVHLMNLISSQASIHLFFHFKELFTTHGKGGFDGFRGDINFRVRTFSYMFYFRFKNLFTRHGKDGYYGFYGDMKLRLSFDSTIGQALIQLISSNSKTS